MTFADRYTFTIFAGIAVLVVALLVALDPSSILAVALLPAIIAAALFTWGALQGSKTSVLLLLFVAVFMIDAVFRVRAYDDKGIDFQVALKLGIWLAIAGVALLHARDWLANVLTATNVPVVMFLLWLVVSAAYSPVPAYSAIAAFSIVTYVIFSAYLFATLDQVDIFGLIVFALIAFCIVSIIVYFAVPQFGHYVYWVNGERYLSPRLAGIAGSANNMGRIAALGLVITGLYARELYQRHGLLVPFGALIAVAALVLTNSRTSMAMVAAILFATYFLSWRRLYAVVFIISASLVALAILLPAGDEILRLISRSGSLDEVTSMTGRTDIWYAVAKLAEARPLTGFGYGSSVFVLPQHERDIGFLTSHAHNLMLQLYLTTGWVGVMLFSMSVLTVGLRAIISGERVVLALLSFVLLNGVTESSGFTTVANICSFAFALAVTFPNSRVAYDYDPAYQR